MDYFYRLIIGFTVACILNFVAMKFLPLSKQILGKDRGREFAIGSEVNIGKPTGVGFYFVIIFVLVAFIVSYKSLGLGIIFGLILIEMLTGYFDDRAKNPWNPYIKGFLDFVIALGGAFTVVYFFGNKAVLGINGLNLTINPILYFVLAAILIVVSINATNATDGIDGLSGALSILSVITIIIVSAIAGSLELNGLIIGIVLIGVLLTYLIFNFYPSKVLMGDAGSRAIGFFIAFYAMYMKVPFAYLIVGLPFMLDGGLSILKITIGRITKKKIIILKTVKTPIHDHLKSKYSMPVPKVWRTITGIALIIDAVYILLCYLINR